MQGLWASPQDVERFAEAVSAARPDGRLSGLRLLGEGFGSVALQSDRGLVVLVAKNAMGSASRRVTLGLAPALAASVSVAVPQPVWHVEEAPGLEHGAYAYAALPGRPLRIDEMRTASEGLVRDIAAFMLALHRFPAGEAARLGATDRKGFWADIESLRGDVDAALGKRLEPMEYERVTGWWDEFLTDDCLRSPPPALVHGDLWPDNLLVNQDATRLLGVIDFGDAAVLDAAYDFAPITENGPGYERFRDAYVALGGEIDGGFERRLQRYHELRSGSFFSLRAAIRGRDEGELQDCLRKLRASPILSERQST